MTPKLEKLKEILLKHNIDKKFNVDIINVLEYIARVSVFLEESDLDSDLDSDLRDYFTKDGKMKRSDSLPMELFLLSLIISFLSKSKPPQSE